MMDATERELLAGGLRHAVAQGTAPDVDAALTELGWLDALAADPCAAVSTLFELQGAAGATSSALDDVLAGALGVKLDDPVAVVLPRIGTHEAPAGDGSTVHGLATGALGRRPGALVVAGAVAQLVDPATLTIRSAAGLDPALGLSEITGDLGRGDGEAVLPVDWPAALSAGQVAIGHELVGASRAILALARDHAVDRIQFGRPIASFQAVRHRLAECLVAIEAADAALAAAWQAPSARHAAMAKACAGRSARLVARHGQQVLGGIGFTTDHPFHRYLRRVLVLDQLLGSARTLTRELGEELLADRRLPIPLAL